MPIIGGGNATGPGEVICQEALFTEVSNTGGVYTASVTVPPMSWLLDIRLYGQVLWTSATSASIIVGDGVDDNGWYVASDTKATDLLAGEVITFESAGGRHGAYLTTAELRSTMWSALQRVITAKITTVTTAASVAGRTRMLVIYTTQANAVAAVFAP